MRTDDKSKIKLTGRIIELPPEPILLDELMSLIKRFGGTGGILIIETDKKNKIAQYNLTMQRIRENLCLAIYYNEKISLDKQMINEVAE